LPAGWQNYEPAPSGNWEMAQAVARQYEGPRPFDCGSRHRRGKSFGVLGASHFGGHSQNRQLTTRMTRADDGPAAGIQNRIAAVLSPRHGESPPGGQTSSREEGSGIRYHSPLSISNAHDRIAGTAGAEDIPLLQSDQCPTNSRCIGERGVG